MTAATQAGFWGIAEADPERVLLISDVGEEVSAGTVLRTAHQWVHALRSVGLQTGATVAALLPNSVDFVELYLAVAQAGWYLVPLNTHLVGPEIAYILQDADADVLIAHERFAEAAQAGAEESTLPEDRRLAIGHIAGFRSSPELLADQPTTAPPERLAGGIMNYTSGTTGKPKGVRRRLPTLTPEAVSAASAGLLSVFGIGGGDDEVHIVCSPLYHGGPLTFAMGALNLGHTLVIMDQWDPERMLELIERWRVTNSHMVPTQFQRLLALPTDVRARHDVSSLRHMVHAAAPCSIDVKNRMIEWWGLVIDEYYAASEGGGSYVTAAEWLERPGTVGRAWPNTELAIYDDNGVRLTEPNQIGTVYMRSGFAELFEYHKDSAKTGNSRRDGFFTVGDVGELDEEGWLFLRDRKIDMIISGGANIYPSEVEAILLSCPKVADAAVFGIPNDEWGEEVKAVVQPAPGIAAGPELARDIFEFCTGRLARFKMPRSVDFVEQLPRDPNGKLYKRKLRDPYWQGTGQAI